MIDLDGFRRYLEDRQLRPRTIQVYLHAVSHCLGRGDPMDSIRRAKSPGRRQQLRAAVLLWARYIGGEEGLRLQQEIADLPRHRIREKPPERPLVAQEWSALLRAAGELQMPLGHVLALLMLTGLRISDVLDIEYDRSVVALESGTLYVRVKGGGYRPYPVVDDVFDELQALVHGWEWKLLRDLVSSGSTDNAAYMVVYRSLRRLGQVAEVSHDRLHPHLFRSTAAYHLWKKTKDIYIVQKFLGHRSIATTEKYLRWIAPEDLDDAYRALDEGRREER